MEPAQAKPLKRRHRWLIAAFVVFVLVSLVSWWHWPRGDARFVGKWDSKTGFVIVSHLEYEFMPNGWGRKKELNFADAPQRFRWWVEDSCLVLERHPFLEVSRFRATEAVYQLGLFNFADWINSGGGVVLTERLPIKDVKANEFSVEDVDGLATSRWAIIRKFTRIPE